jgi:hypothetical protein
MSGINVKNILQRSIHGPVHLKLACWPWNPMVDFKRRATRGRKYWSRWRTFSSRFSTSSSTTAVRYGCPPWPSTLDDSINGERFPLSSSLQWVSLVLGHFSKRWDSSMSGINIKNILQRSIHGPMHLKLARWSWNPMVDFERRATRGRKCWSRWRAFSSRFSTSSSTTAIFHGRPPGAFH